MISCLSLTGEILLNAFDPFLLRMAKNSRVPGSTYEDLLQYARIVAVECIQKTQMVSGDLIQYITSCVKNQFHKLRKKSCQGSEIPLHLVKESDIIDKDRCTTTDLFNRQVYERCLLLLDNKIDKAIFVGFLNNETDVEMANELQISRQAVFNRRNRMFEIFRQVLKDEGFYEA